MLKLKQSLLSIAIGLALAAGISYAAPWTGPTADPTGGNVAAPINVSANTQIFNGSKLLFMNNNSTGVLGISGSIWTNGIVNADSGIITSGSVGIGTTTPQAKLDVNGDIKVTGNICTAKGNCLDNQWINIPLTDTSNFNENCLYRMKLGRNYGGAGETWANLYGFQTNPYMYLMGISPEKAFHVAHSDVIGYTKASSKNTWFVSIGSGVNFQELV